MKILITEDRKLHLQAIGNTAQQEAATRQELAVSIEFADTSLIDADTDEVLLKIKTSRAAEDLAASATIARVGETAVFSGFINLSTSILNELADGSIVLMECTWVLATKVQRSDPRQLMIRQAIVTGDEGAPEADQSVADRLTWLSENILAGDNITITEDSDLGTITISSEAGGDVAWDDITGKPSVFTPDTHAHVIADTTGLQAAIDGKAATSHSHIIGDTTGLQTALDGKSDTGHTHVKADVGLGNVDNTSDANKPVSTATQTALDLKLNLAGGAVSGLTGLGIRSTGAAFDLTLASAEVLTAGRTLSFNVGDAARTLTIPATGTVALLGTANVFTAVQTVPNNNGSNILPSIRFTSDTSMGISFYPGAGLVINAASQHPVTITAGAVTLSSNCTLGWGTSGITYVAGDVFLSRDTTKTLALKNGANQQTFRIYGNTTGSKYLHLTHDGTNAKITASSGDVHISNIPTSNPGPGILWNNGGTLAIGT